MPLLDTFWAKIQPFVFMVGAGGLNAVGEYLDSYNYEGPIDWTHVQKLFFQGVVAGLGAYFLQRKQVYKALMTPVPGGEDREILKRSAAAAGGTPNA